MKELREDYFRWVVNLVSDNGRINGRSYLQLLNKLNATPFRYSLGRDANRASDGRSLRYRFGYDNKLSDELIEQEIDIFAPSCLEVLAALASRMEDIMSDGEIGDRTKEWFFEMINNLGLSSFFDCNFFEEYVDDILDRWLDRDYSYYGQGNIFVVRHPAADLRQTEIWYQAMWYLDEILYY